MSMSVGTTGGTKLLLDAIRVGKVKSREDAERMSGLAGRAVSCALQRLLDAGLITYEKPHPRAIDYESIRPTSGSAPTKMAPARKPRTKAAKAEPVVETPAPAPALTAPTATGSLVGARAVIYDDSEIAKLEGRVVAAEENAKFLRALIEDIRAQKPLDAEAALLIGVVAKLQAFPKPEAP